jgi:lipase chaperone LimK
MNRLGWTVAIAAAVVVLAATLSLTRTSRVVEFEAGTLPAQTGAAVSGHRRPMGPSPQVVASESAALQMEFSPRPLSLLGTDADGALSVDEEGHFVPNPDALAFFDYFLTATGEMSEADLRNYILAKIRRRLSGPAASGAETLLDRYLVFRTAVRDLVGSGVAPSGVERRWQWIRELRREHFGAEMAATLFGESEQVVRVDLERWRQSQDPSLGSRDRRDLLESMDERLPQKVREARERVLAPARSYQEASALRAAGASNEEIFVARQNRFGRDAAQRLADLDVAKEHWWKRFAGYSEQRDDLLAEMAEAEASPGERNAALEALLEQHFEPSERRRARALGASFP